MKYQTYPAYKDSGVEWLGDVPEHWDIKRIKETANLINGYPFDSTLFDASQGFPLVRIRDINSLKTEVGYNGYVPAHAIIDDGDILIGMDGDFNVARWNGGKSALNQRVACVRADNYFLQKFIFYALPFNMKVVNDLTYFTTVKHLSSIDILKTTFAYPSENELANIVNFLDHETAKIDTLIEKQQRLIELLKEKRQAVISHAVTKGLNPSLPMKDSGVEWLGEVPEGWIVCRLKQVIKSGSSISYGIVQPGEPLDYGVPFIQTTNMSKGSFELDELQKTTKEIAESYPRSKLDGGEVILGIRASIGAAYVVPLVLRGVNLSRGVARIIPNEHILSDYLVLFFSSGVVENYWGLSKQGSTFSEVSIETVRELWLSVPPIHEQNEITISLRNKMAKFDYLTERANQAISLMQERRTALISAAVTGKIDVREWSEKQ